jgi:hypothetical protein
MTNLHSRFNDEYDNTLIQKNDNDPNRPVPDDDPNDNPVEPDKGDEIPQTENDIESDNDDVLNESIVEPELIPSEDVDTSTAQIGSNGGQDKSDVPSPADIDRERNFPSSGPAGTAYKINSEDADQIGKTDEDEVTDSVKSYEQNDLANSGS